MTNTTSNTDILSHLKMRCNRINWTLPCELACVGLFAALVDLAFPSIKEALRPTSTFDKNKTEIITPAKKSILGKLLHYSSNFIEEKALPDRSGMNYN